jgi:hypothetical protein
MVRQAFFVFATVLNCALCLEAEMIVDYGPTEVGRDSHIDVRWSPPRPLAGAVQPGPVAPPFFAPTSISADTAGRLMIDCWFRPDTVGHFQDTLVRGWNENGLDPDLLLIVRGEGVLARREAVRDLRPPSSFILSAFPNPFNPATEVTFNLLKAEQVSLRLFNTLGQHVSTLQDDIMSAGTHRVSFDGSHFPAGIYFLRLEAGSHQRTLKLVLLK